MCKHILNAQVSIRAPCCKQWFDCSECHAESADHPLMKEHEMAFACKKCKKCFRKDTREWDPESDNFCPHCDNCFVIEAVTKEDQKKGKLVLELEQSHGVKRKIELSAEELAELESMM
ncbi:hypothetical protein AKO1_014140 [Acrasis kona]|uniref:CHY-type domain-containing protein n=1 Tax=Acrasis kona TaxID=1008807 RepID=A0AAW2YZA9_9EUKA